MMEIGGLGGVSKDLGIPMQKNLFSPRLGAPTASRTGRFSAAESG